MSYWCDKHSQYKPCRACQMEALRNKQEKSDGMTPTNHLDELKKLRDETYSPFKRTPEQIAALDHAIKREESLANTEGHAAVLRELAELKVMDFGNEYGEHLKAGAIAITERPALIAEAKQTADVLREVIAWNDKYPNTRWYSQAECRRMGKELDAICERGRLALKEQTHE